MLSHHCTLLPIPSLDFSYYYYIPIITVLVIALFFPSGKSRPSKVNTSESKADDGIAEDKKIKQE